jgi:poly(ribitol-phosphate) beta-N-acetylglucosaminyltransferase
MQPSVSVIVPVYNPGHHIDDCIASLLEQSMPGGALELIFVDDGSTDGTPARLDALAADHAHVKVVHIPNSGWPGRPRNIGIDMARGEFVYFVDNDDWVEHDAIERMHATAVGDGADIVIGKVVGHDRKVPRGLFRETVHAAPFDSVKFLGLLTPHKLFRRAMLLEHGIRFPEGRLRLEDHLFVVHAYFHAAGITVLADRPAYHWVLRDIARHASSRRLDPEGYYGNVREVLDLVCEHTEPGPWRDRLLTHWYRGKMLGRVGGRGFANREEEFNRELVGAIRSLALDRYDDRVHERLAFNMRARSLLLRAGDYDGLLRLAELESALHARVRARVQGDGRRLTLSLRAALRGLEFARDGERLAWRPPAPLRAVLDGLDATAAVQDSNVQVLLHSLRDGIEYTLPARTTVALEDGTRPVLRTDVDVEVATAAAGARLPDGDWELRVIVTVAGFSHARSVRRNGAPVVLTAASGRLSVRRDVLLRQPMLRRVLARLQPAMPIVNRA